MRVDNKIYWNLFKNLFTETTLLLECRKQTKKKKQNKTVSESKSTLQKEEGR